MRMACFATLFLFAACGPPGAPDAKSCGNTIEVAWGTGESGTFTPFAENQDAELVLGFQGFLFIASTLRVEGSETQSAGVVFTISVDGEDTFTSNSGQTALETGGDGYFYSEEVRAFFNELPLATLVGKAATIQVGVTIDDCVATTSATVHLVDNDACIDTGSPEPACPDAGI